MDSGAASAALTEVLQMLRRAGALAEEATGRRERSGEAVTERTPPVVAQAALKDAIDEVEGGTAGPGWRTLGLARGASEFVWLPDETELRELLSEIDAYWEEHIWDGSGPRPWQSLKVRHVRRDPSS